jgi:hypothetical protein
VTRLLPLALAAGALVLAGCGGGTRLSREELVTKADAICKDYNARFTALGTPNSLEELKTFADKALPIAKEGNSKLAALKPPASLEDTYKAWLAEGDKAVDAIGRLSTAARTNDTAEVRRIGREAARENQRSNRLARQLGFESCAES